MPSFLADCNVGRLARWLRVLGYDAAYESRLDDARLVARALAERRVLLTRDSDMVHRRAIASGALRCILLRDDRVEAQLRQVVSDLGLHPEQVLTRCLECNVELEPRAKAAVLQLLPPHVRLIQDRFSQCTRCARVYWPGTHWDRMRARIAEL